MSSLTPQPIDTFSRFMAAMFDERQIISVPTGFQAFFGNPAAGAATHYSPDSASVDIDIIRSGKKMAALIPRGIYSTDVGDLAKDLQAGRNTTFSRKYPLIVERGHIGGDDLLNRQAGEPSYNGKTRIERLRDKAQALHSESIRRIVRTFEYLAASSILTGKQPAIIGTVDPDLMYDFRRHDTHTVTISAAWNSPEADIMGDLDSSCDLLERDANLSPDMLCIGGTAHSAMIHDTTFQNLADNRRMEFIQLGQDDAPPVPPNFARFVNSGWIPMGRLRTPKGYSLWVFTYNRTYQDDNGAATKLMPVDRAFITSSFSRCDRYFGPPEMLPMTAQRAELYQELFGFDPRVPLMPVNILNAGAAVDPSMFHCDGYPSTDWKVVTIRTQAAPIFATTQTDAFVILQGLVG